MQKQREDTGSGVPVPSPVWTQACPEQKRGEHGRNSDQFTREESENWTEADPAGCDREEGGVERESLHTGEDGAKAEFQEN